VTGLSPDLLTRASSLVKQRVSKFLFILIMKTTLKQVAKLVNKMLQKCFGYRI